MSFFRYVIANHAVVLQRTLEHVGLVAISSGLAIAIGVPAGILLKALGLNVQGILDRFYERRTYRFGKDGLQVRFVPEQFLGSRAVTTIKVDGKRIVAEALAACTVNAAHVLGRADRLGRIARGYRADLVLLDAPDWRYLAYHLGGDVVAGQRIGDEPPVAARFDQARFPEHPQMGARELHVDLGFAREDFDRLLALRQQFQHFQALRAGERLAHPGDVLVEKVFQRAAHRDL